MPTPPKPISEEAKGGLQDDHDPRDPARRATMPSVQREGGSHVNEEGRRLHPPKEPAGPVTETTRAAAKWISSGCLRTTASTASGFPEVRRKSGPELPQYAQASREPDGRHASQKQHNYGNIDKGSRFCGDEHDVQTPKFVERRLRSAAEQGR